MRRAIVIAVNMDDKSESCENPVRFAAKRREIIAVGGTIASSNEGSIRIR